MRKSTRGIDRLYTNNLTLSGLSCRRRIRTAVLKNMSLVRFHFSALPCVDFQRICTGNPQADCFLHLGQHPHISYSDEIMGEDGVEPPEPESNRFTVCTATSTEYSPKTRAPRVSNMFIVLCFPLGCLCRASPTKLFRILLCLLTLCFLKTPLSSMRACDGLLKLRNIYRTGNQIKHKPMPLHTFAHSDSHTLIRKFFLPIKRMGSIRKKWKF